MSKFPTGLTSQRELKPARTPGALIHNPTLEPRTMHGKVMQQRPQPGSASGYDRLTGESAASMPRSRLIRSISMCLMIGRWIDGMMRPS
jgi:hypothetical protein